MKFVKDDGGRKKAGYKGNAGDCVVRSIAIAAQLDYRDVYDILSHGVRTQRGARGGSARDGVSVTRKWFKERMVKWGFVWYPTMHVGTGCQVHLADGELPDGRLVVALSRHYTAVINQTIRDTYNPAREGTRCVYGYWKLEA